MFRMKLTLQKISYSSHEISTIFMIPSFTFHHIMKCNILFKGTSSTDFKNFNESCFHEKLRLWYIHKNLLIHHSVLTSLWKDTFTYFDFYCYLRICVRIRRCFLMTLSVEELESIDFEVLKFWLDRLVGSWTHIRPFESYTVKMTILVEILYLFYWIKLVALYLHQQNFLNIFFMILASLGCENNKNENSFNLHLNFF
jgi:hypothetical protein